jgi:ribonuclease P protein component
MRRRSEFTTTVRTGRRAATRALTLHLAGPDTAPRASAQIGFIVPRTVGGAVQRNRVRRRLRHLLTGQLSAVPKGASLVVRVAPAAASMSSAELARELDKALTRLGGTTGSTPRDISRGDT